MNLFGKYIESDNTGHYIAFHTVMHCLLVTSEYFGYQCLLTFVSEAGVMLLSVLY